jgi:hypothetical protein
LKHALETCKQAPVAPEKGEWMLTFHCTQITQSILDQLLKFGNVNQQKAMLARVLDHKLLSAIRLDHWLSFKDVATTTKIVENVKSRLQTIREGKSNNQLTTKYATLNKHIFN